MEGSINLQRSIEKRRLIYENRTMIADYIITYIGFLFFIILAGILLVTKITVMPFWVFGFVVGFIIWMIANATLSNFLIKVDGRDVTSNRQDIITVLNDFFHLNIEDSDQIVIENVKLSGFIHWGRVITLLLDNNSIYINIQTLGRSDAISFFHGFTNYLKSRRIAKRFSQIQFNNTSV